VTKQLLFFQLLTSLDLACILAFLVILKLYRFLLKICFFNMVFQVLELKSTEMHRAVGDALRDKKKVPASTNGGCPKNC
jgi:hypothetical protein